MFLVEKFIFVISFTGIVLVELLSLIDEIFLVLLSRIKKKNLVQSQELVSREIASQTRNMVGSGSGMFLVEKKVLRHFFCCHCSGCVDFSR